MSSAHPDLPRAPAPEDRPPARADVVILGGGHNGLVAAAYLARAGVRVTLVERLPHLGGAAISAPAFSGHPVRLSRYSYLVSLMPTRLMDDLDLDLRLHSRRTASYTPVVRDGRAGGLLVERVERDATRRSFRELTGGEQEFRAWRRFYDDVGTLARAVAPTLMEPLPTERAIRDQVDDAVWRDLVQQPLGETIERRFLDDTVRGVVATDALIGTFASLHDPSLVQNRCFLYHLIGNGTGEWRVPEGGMGAVTDALAAAARRAGARLVTGTEVTAVRTGPGGVEVAVRDADGDYTVQAALALANVAPTVLHDLTRDDLDDRTPPPAPEGAQLKINLLLTRLPRLRSGIDPSVAFAGTLHLGEDYSQLEAAYRDAAAGRVPSVMPGEVYCHSLTDPSILGGAPEGTHTLTYFGLHTPASLFAADPEATRARAVERALATLDRHLEEPIADCLARDADGRPCLEAKIPQDIERDLAMPGGHLFHGDLEWPWVPNRLRLDTPAQRWGVETAHARILICGSGSRRGGAVSGLGGHSAARAALDLL
ncbi:phytoene desaturase family protein [Nocardioides sp.]|uniref:phytoene desaturase family protein n=1 Tax=Nocardioides sp. TaxID=35761 RepID=UPI00351684FB